MSTLKEISEFLKRNPLSNCVLYETEVSESKDDLISDEVLNHHINLLRSKKDVF